MTKDKQLREIKLEDVLERRRLGQALNIKEFAVLAGISYSLARDWFQMKGFPRFEGVVFWQDFVDWRNNRNGGTALLNDSHHPAVSVPALETNFQFRTAPARRTDSSRIREMKAFTPH